MGNITIEISQMKCICSEKMFTWIFVRVCKNILTYVSRPTIFNNETFHKMFIEVWLNRISLLQCRQAQSQLSKFLESTVRLTGFYNSKLRIRTRCIFLNERANSDACFNLFLIRRDHLRDEDDVTTCHWCTWDISKIMHPEFIL